MARRSPDGRNRAVCDGLHDVDPAVRWATAWQERLGIGDWPTIYRIHSGPLQIVRGDIDVVLLPVSANTETDVLAAVMAYAFADVPQNQHPTSAELAKAAHELARSLT